MVTFWVGLPLFLSLFGDKQVTAGRRQFESHYCKVDGDPFGEFTAEQAKFFGVKRRAIATCLRLVLPKKCLVG